MQIRAKEGSKIKVKCKGITKAYRDRIKFEQYVSCITRTARIKSQMRTIRARNNVLKIIHQSKQAVSSFDDKRWLLPCGHSLGYASTYAHIANVFCPYCPNADTFYTDKRFEEIIDVSGEWNIFRFCYIVRLFSMNNKATRPTTSHGFEVLILSLDLSKENMLFH